MLSALLSACHAEKKAEETSEPKVTADSVTMPANSPQLSALKIEPVETNEPVTVPLTGRLIWDEEATVRVFTPFAGIIRHTFVNVGQSVTNGTPLAEIQSADFGQAQADARKAASDYRRAEHNLARVKDLFEHGAAPNKDVEGAEADFSSAAAEKDRAESRLAIYGVSLDSTNHNFLLPSPLDGVLVEKNVTPGEEVRPDQMLANMPQFTAPLFVITDPSRLWIQIDASEADLPRLRSGCELRFTSRALPGQTFTGRVETVSEFIDPVTRTIKVRGSVDNSRRLLKAELFVNVQLSESETAGATVPTKAVFLSGEKHYVFLEQQPGQFLRKEVQIGSEQDGRLLVLAGLQPGQRVVTDGCVLLQETLK